jgi:hypothetical protein
MNIQTNVLEAVLKKYAKTDKELFTSLENISEDKFVKILEQLNLSSNNKRNAFYWELQVIIEKIVSESSGSEDNERLAETIVENWNKTKEPKISQTIILSFLYTLNLKFPNSRKAFIAVCDGDLQSYKAFNSKPRLFIDLLVRFLACVNIKQQNTNIFRVLEEVTPLLFDDVSKSDYNDSITRLGFRSKKGLNYGKMNAYKKVMGFENLVYAEGMKSILLEVIDGVEETETLAILKEKLNASTVKEEQGETEEDFQVDDLMDKNTPEMHKSEVAEQEQTKEPSIDSDVPDKRTDIHTETQNETPAESNAKESVVMSAVGKVPTRKESESQESDHKDDIVSLLENALSSIQSVLTQATQLSEVHVKTQQTSQSESNQQKLGIAEEEINRLKLSLQQEKEKVAQVEEKAYTKVLQAIGGESSNYLLSDLFEESQGKAPSNPDISAGRLINLFSSLSLAIGLEEHSNHYELGQTFPVQKKELIKNYRIDSPITNQSEEIQVKLLKYGWSINGKVVVQPLVTEVKGEI